MVLLAASESRAAQSTRTAPGAFDANCNGGRGQALQFPNVSNSIFYNAVALKSGVVVVGVTYDLSTSTATSPAFVLEAVNADCTPDLGFGVRGRENLHWPGNFLGLPETMASSVDGGFFVFGGSNGRLIATELDANGLIDRSFGKNGWLIRKLPGFSPSTEFYPDVSALIQEGDGTILLGGSNGEAHCCTVPRVYAFTAKGRLVWSYVPYSQPTSKVLPIGTEIDHLVPRANGTIAILAELVFGGCGTQELASLDPSGHLEHAATANLQRDVAALPANSYNWADGYLGKHGALILVGGAQTHCNGRQWPREFVQHLGPTGELLGQPFQWLTPRPNGSYSFGTAMPNGSFVASSTNVPGNVLALHEYSANGARNASFADHGSLAIRMCAPDSFTGNCALTVVGGGATFLQGPPGDFDVLVTRPQGLTLFEIGQ